MFQIHSQFDYLAMCTSRVVTCKQICYIKNHCVKPIHK